MFARRPAVAARAEASTACAAAGSGRCAPPVAASFALAAVIGLAAALSGCGFQLRAWELSGAFAVTSAAPGPLGRELERALQRSGAAIVDAAAAAAVVVRLFDEAESRRGVSLTPGGQVAEYEIVLQVAFAAEDAQGKPILAKRSLRAARVYRLDESNLIGSRAEETLILRELRADLVQRIVRSLGVAADAD